MPLFSSIEDKRRVNEPDYEPDVPPPDERYTPAPAKDTEYDVGIAGIALAMLGAIALITSVFLPLDEAPNAIVTIQKNTFIQHGHWEFLAGGVVIALVALRSYISGWRTWTIAVLGLIAGGLATVAATNKGLRTLVSLHGGVESSPEVVPSGIAIYVAGAGAALALVGGWIAWRTATHVMRCPDCAEKMLAEAHVCKHCGYRLAEGV